MRPVRLHRHCVCALRRLRALPRSSQSNYASGAFSSVTDVDSHGCVCGCGVIQQCLFGWTFCAVSASDAPLRSGGAASAVARPLDPQARSCWCSAERCKDPCRKARRCPQQSSAAELLQVCVVRPGVAARCAVCAVHAPCRPERSAPLAPPVRVNSSPVSTLALSTRKQRINVVDGGAVRGTPRDRPPRGGGGGRKLRPTAPDPNELPGRVVERRFCTVLRGLCANSPHEK